MAGLLFAPWAYAGDLLVSTYNPVAGGILRYNGQTGAFIAPLVPVGAVPSPTGMTFGPDGYLYLASQPPSSVLKVDPITGTVVSAFITPATSGGLTTVGDIAFGPDGNFYAADFSTANVKRYNGSTGAFMGVFTSGFALVNPGSMAFGPDGNLYVGDEINIVRYNGSTGAFMSLFVPPGSNGAPVPPCGPTSVRFGPDGNLYSTAGYCGSIGRYDGKTGAFLGFFISSGSGGLHAPTGITWGADGDMYVADAGGSITVTGQTGQVLRYDGTTGAFLGTFVPPGSGGLYNANVILFTPRPPSILCTGSYFFSNGLRASLAFNVASVGSVSTFTYNYRSSTQTVQFVSGTTSWISVNGNTATFSGQGKLNGVDGYNFTVIAKDGGAAGSGLDTVSITITGPNNYSYSVNATIVGGDVVVKQ